MVLKANDRAHLPGPLQELDVARNQSCGPSQVQRLVRRLALLDFDLANRRPRRQILNLKMDLAKDTEMHRKIGRLEVVRLDLASKDRGNFEAKTLPRSQRLTRTQQIANEVGDEPFIGVIALHNQFLEFVSVLRNEN